MLALSCQSLAFSGAAVPMQSRTAGVSMMDVEGLKVRATRVLKTFAAGSSSIHAASSTRSQHFAATTRRSHFIMLTTALLQLVCAPRDRRPRPSRSTRSSASGTRSTFRVASSGVTPTRRPLASCARLRSSTAASRWPRSLASSCTPTASASRGRRATPWRMASRPSSCGTPSRRSPSGRSS